MVANLNNSVQPCGEAVLPESCKWSCKVLTLAFCSFNPSLDNSQRSPLQPATSTPSESRIMNLISLRSASPRLHRSFPLIVDFSFNPYRSSSSRAVPALRLQSSIKKSNGIIAQGIGIASRWGLVTGACARSGTVSGTRWCVFRLDVKSAESCNRGCLDVEQ
jgi:hypothetical protein